LDFIDRTSSIPNEQSNNNVDENKTNSIFVYSTIVLLMIIVLVMTYYIGSLKNQKYSSSSSEINSGRAENTKIEKSNDNMNKRNHHDSISNPYII